MSPSTLPPNPQASYVMGVCIAMFILLTIFVAARFWIRLSFSKSKFGADDWCILVAWALAASLDLSIIQEVKFGLGQHYYDLPQPNQFGKALEVYYFGEMIYCMCVGITKAAILLLYLRLATSKTLRTSMWCIMAVAIASALASSVGGLFQCNPIHKAWDTTGLVDGSCIDVNALFYANAGLDIIQDIIIYILPMKMIYQIRIPRRQKYALILVFAVGGFVVITGMIRLYYLKGAEASTDPSYDNTGAAVWSVIECNTGVICASLPHFKAVFDRFFPSLMGRSRGLTDGSAGPSLGRTGNYIKHASRKDAEYALESQTGKSGWNNTYSGKFDKNAMINIEGGKYNGHSSEEYLRGVDGHDGNGIYKSTQIILTRTTAD